jgi:hypothetical protein
MRKLRLLSSLAKTVVELTLGLELRCLGPKAAFLTLMFRGFVRSFANSNKSDLVLFSFLPVRSDFMLLFSSSKPLVQSLMVERPSKMALKVECRLGP